MSQQVLTINGAALVADLSGALSWPERRLVAVADLHLEKGSGFAGRGQLLPPYDTAATLDRLEEVLGRLRPETVVCLGDSFHDRGAAARMGRDDRRRLAALCSGHDWIWIAGNHDPDAPDDLDGRATAELVLGPLVFRHEGRAGAVGEISGHLHPVAAVRVRGRRIRLRCFAEDGLRAVLPAFGAYTGGLNVLDGAYAPLLGARFTAHLLGRERVFALPSARLEGDSAGLPRQGTSPPESRCTKGSGTNGFD
ncbi:ligase-associated DNA damage response endonuclease PdeM [Arenibaculum pallidiluteum]|uniref:ligase-associated DNA damage response endonuclease PdeM n=1 Tax=Arenibaculum pallidiluteum TaxID=2812559 RepID=UPI001A9607F2|nr:ligase-associated DNA damage response endonuclease PdeM [Arenibaculum pallidiluteum]